ncbi:MAG: NADH-quinone oxidoreductase subunit J [Alphaproteobacteria bacterium]|nr:NADH-quinone oxidoreductase subunit J [Alphaproteobacteria bacterium]
MNEALVFYVLATFSIISAVMVVFSCAVNSVLFLIMVFISVSGLFLLLGAEFLAMMLLIIYAGAFAVLLLMLPLMLNIKETYQHTAVKCSAFGVTVGLLLFSCLAFVLKVKPQRLENDVSLAVANNVKALGEVLYTDYAYLFQLCGMVLFVAIVGVIMLMIRNGMEIKEHKIAGQIIRSADEIELKQLTDGEK